MGFGFHRYITDEERAEVARLNFELRGNFNGLIELVEKAAARVAAEEREAAAAVTLLRRLSLALDLSYLFSRPGQTEEVMKAAGDVTDKILGPGVGLNPPPVITSARAERLPDDAEEWGDTLGGE